MKKRNEKSTNVQRKLKKPNVHAVTGSRMINKSSAIDGGMPMYNETEPDSEKQPIFEDIDKKIEEKFENAKKEKELKESVSDVFNSILEDDDDELKDTLNDVFNSVRK